MAEKADTDDFIRLSCTRMSLGRIPNILVKSEIESNFNRCYIIDHLLGLILHDREFSHKLLMSLIFLFTLSKVKMPRERNVALPFNIRNRTKLFASNSESH